MKVYYQDGKPRLTWGFHELAVSRRTEGFTYSFFSLHGEELEGWLETTKRAGNYVLPEGAKYLLTRYFTNSEYPQHSVLTLPELNTLAILTEQTDREAVQRFNLPGLLKCYILEDLNL